MAERDEGTERDILEQRTRAAAEPVTRPERMEELGAIEFVVAGERRAMGLEVLRGIVPIEVLAPIPRAPAEVAGLLLYEGSVVPVFELSVLLSLPGRGAPERSYVLLLGRERVEVGLRIDEVGSLLRVDGGVGFAPASTAPLRSEWICGLTDSGTPIVDGARLLASDRLYVEVGLAREHRAVRSGDA